MIFPQYKPVRKRKMFSIIHIRTTSLVCELIIMVRKYVYNHFLDYSFCKEEKNEEAKLNLRHVLVFIATSTNILKVRYLFRYNPLF